MTATGELGAFVRGVSYRDLPAPVIETALACVKDSIGCLLGGVDSEPGRHAAALVEEMGGAPQASLARRGVRLPAPLSAFAHATMANAFDFDDTLFGHPGATVVPTALALGEWLGTDGPTLIAAIVAGYEVSARVASCARPIIPRFVAVWDLGTLQTYGVAATAGRLLGLSEQALGHAFGLAGATGPVPLGRKPRAPADEGRSMVKSAYGWAAFSGILAARLAQEGFTGPPRIFDGTMGFWDMGASQSARIRDITDGLGRRFVIEDVQFKPYPACRFIHPVLDGIRDVLNRGVHAATVAEVDVRGFRLLADEYHNIPRPGSVTDAQFSVPYCVAAMLVDGALSPAAFAPERLRDTRLLAVADRVRVGVDPEFDGLFPATQGAAVGVTTVDGSRFEIRVDGARGGPQRPLSSAELDEKFMMLAVPALGSQGARLVSRLIDEMPQAREVTPLADLLRGE